MTQNYVREFQRWNRASEVSKPDIAREQAWDHSEGILIFPEWTQGIDTLTPCGKRLGECSKADLEAMAAWHYALAKANGDLIEKVEELLKVPEAGQ